MARLADRFVRRPRVGREKSRSEPRTRRRKALTRLYPIIRRKDLRWATSSGIRRLSGWLPSMTPRTPRPCSDSATTTWTGLAVAQKMEQTSGTSLMRPRMLMG